VGIATRPLPICVPILYVPIQYIMLILLPTTIVERVSGYLSFVVDTPLRELLRRLEAI